MKGTVKTIEGYVAVIEIGTPGHKVIFPLHLLPEGIKEGHVLNINIEIDKNTPISPPTKVTHIENKFMERKKERN